MLNRELFQNDPLKQQLLNDGVAKVYDSQDAKELEVLRQELQNFVCEGEYEKGLEHILSTFLKHLDSPNQPAVWVSGFFGSGKSHLLKVLKSLWVDTEFPDKATARGVVRLSLPVKDQIKELAHRAKGYGGLHAASGTLGAGAGDSVRKAFLSIIFRSKGLPEDFAQARFVLWLTREGRLEEVKKAIGGKWEFELRNFRVSTELAKALVSEVPTFHGLSLADAGKRLKEEFPNVADVSEEEMIHAIEETLGSGKHFPLTLVALDEVQQWIGTTPERTFAVQEVTQACSSKFQGRLLFVATGQSALKETPHLQKLQDRFSVQISLSDTDVDRVVRTVVLAKREDRKEAIKAALAPCSGEIARHLKESKLAASREDEQTLVSDYPLLPVRRRFWEQALRAIDQTGSTTQLRSQLRVVLQAVKDTAEQPVGHVIPGEALFFQMAPDMERIRVLSSTFSQTISKLKAQGPEGSLKARLCAATFLIGKLPREVGADKGVRATEEQLADLLVEDLPKGSTELRGKVPGLLKQLLEDGILMKVGSEFRVQTVEGKNWEDEYLRQRNLLQKDVAILPAERESRLMEAFKAAATLKTTQGVSKTPRSVEAHRSNSAPKSDGRTLHVWVRDGWTETATQVENDAKAQGTSSSLIFVFLPNRAGHDLNEALLNLKAAQATIHHKGTQVTPEGQEAEMAMKSRVVSADGHLNNHMADILSNAQVWMSGGQEIVESSLEKSLIKALHGAQARLFPDFGKADDPKWEQVLKKAQSGAQDALKELGFTGDPQSYPVCADLLRGMGPGMKGADLRKKFEMEPYGWSGDAIDGGIYVLLANGLICAQQGGKDLLLKDIPRSQVGKVDLKPETVPLTATHKLIARKLYQQVEGVSAKSGDELSSLPLFLDRMKVLAQEASGEPPAPAPHGLTRFKEVEDKSGNAQLVALVDIKDKVEERLAWWKKQKAGIAARMPRWELLSSLVTAGASLPGMTAIAAQADALRTGRGLLNEPDPVEPLIKQAEDVLRAHLQAMENQLLALVKEGDSGLASDATWKAVDTKDQDRIRQEAQLSKLPEFKLGTAETLKETVEAHSLAALSNLVDALPQRYATARQKAAQQLIPEAIQAVLPHRTLKNPVEVEAWVTEVRESLLTEVKKNPVIV